MSKSTNASSLFISTSEMTFSRHELGFIEMYFQKKYPQPVQVLVEATRTLMGLVQSNSKQRLTYTANRTFTEGTNRTELSESLRGSREGDESTAAGVAYIAVEKIEAEDRDKFGNNSVEVEGGVNAVIEQLTQLRNNKAFFKYARGISGVYAGYVVDQLIEYLNHLIEVATIQDYEFVADPLTTQYSLRMSVGHREARSYYAKLYFDFAAE